MTTITPEERERLRELIIAYQIRPNHTDGMKAINELLTKLLNALDAADARAEKAEAERDLIAQEFSAAIQMPNLYDAPFLLETTAATQPGKQVFDAVIEWAAAEAAKEQK